MLSAPTTTQQVLDAIQIGRPVTYHGSAMQWVEASLTAAVPRGDRLDLSVRDYGGETGRLGRARLRSLRIHEYSCNACLPCACGPVNP